MDKEKRDAEFRSALAEAMSSHRFVAESSHVGRDGWNWTEQALVQRCIKETRKGWVDVYSVRFIDSCDNPSWHGRHWGRSAVPIMMSKIALARYFTVRHKWCYDIKFTEVFPPTEKEV